MDHDADMTGLSKVTALCRTYSIEVPPWRSDARDVSLGKVVPVFRSQPCRAFRGGEIDTNNRSSSWWW